MFPTVSDRFIFSEGLIGPIPFMEGDPCARTLHQKLHFDLDIQYSLKITKSQELVKFNTLLHFYTPPRKIGVWGGGKKCNMGIARGYTCYVTFSKPPLMNSHGNTVWGGP